MFKQPVNCIVIYITLGMCIKTFTCRILHKWLTVANVSI